VSVEKLWDELCIGVKCQYPLNIKAESSLKVRSVTG
jgi:hypothetical protein